MRNENHPRNSVISGLGDYEVTSDAEASSVGGSSTGLLTVLNHRAILHIWVMNAVKTHAQSRPEMSPLRLQSATSSSLLETQYWYLIEIIFYPQSKILK